jgi:N-acetylmuramoyl-L-alanine amidase
MSEPWKLYLTKRNLSVLFFVVAFTCVITREVNSGKLKFAQQKKTIVIDPGHGGHDQGAKGPDGTLEKTITLNFAHLLAKELGGKYSVYLTRTDDYGVDFPARTAVANHLKADLFLSIHTGGSFLHQTSGMSLYYHKGVSGAALTLKTEPTQSADGNNAQALWINIQDRHEKNSQLLAELIQHHIKQIKVVKSEIQGVPVMVLEAADMPAILFEIGYITNPSEEKSLLDINLLNRIAEGIENGVNDFFQKVR